MKVWRAYVLVTFLLIAWAPVSSVADDAFYAYQEIDSWLELNGNLLADMVSSLEAEASLFSLQYSSGAGLSSSAGQGSAPALYTGEHAELYQSVLVAAPFSMLITSPQLSFLEPGVFRCGQRQCSFALVFGKESTLDKCNNSALQQVRGRCSFAVAKNWHLNYFWIE